MDSEVANVEMGPDGEMIIVITGPVALLNYLRAQHMEGLLKITGGNAKNSRSRKNAHTVVERIEITGWTIQWPEVGNVVDAWFALAEAGFKANAVATSIAYRPVIPSAVALAVHAAGNGTEH